MLGGTDAWRVDESKSELAPNGVRDQDLGVMIGIAAILEGTLLAGDMPSGLELHLFRRFVSVGLLDDEPGAPPESEPRLALKDPDSRRKLRQALNDLNHRLRYAHGAYDEPIAPIPVPD